MTDDRQNPSAASLALPAVLDLTAAESLKQTLLAAYVPGSSIEIDAGAVQRITTPAIQVFAAAAKTTAGGGGALVFNNVPDVFRDTANMLGLGELLGLVEA